MTKFIRKIDIENSLDTASHCQRNWNLDFEIEEEILNLLEYTVVKSPTKQNQNCYATFFITDRDLIKQIYSTTWREEDGRCDVLKNPQALANLVVIFTDSENVDSDCDMSIGIVAGQLSLVASLNGLRCGFCQCFNSIELSQILHLNNTPKLIMGIGNPNNDKTHNQHQYQDYYFDTFYKEPNIYWIDKNNTSAYVDHIDGLDSVSLVFDNNKKYKIEDIINYNPVDNLSNVIRKYKSIYNITQQTSEKGYIVYFASKQNRLSDFVTAIQKSKEWKEAKTFISCKLNLDLIFTKNP